MTGSGDAGVALVVVVLDGMGVSGTCVVGVT